MGQLLRKGVAELYDAWEATIEADIAAGEAKMAALEAKMAALEAEKAALEAEKAAREAKIADLLREREWWRELKARAADAEDPDAVIAAAMRERERLLAVEPGSEPGDDLGDVGPAKNADTKSAGSGEK
jgi:hypothetical protein